VPVFERVFGGVVPVSAQRNPVLVHTRVLFKHAPAREKSTGTGHFLKTGLLSENRFKKAYLLQAIETAPTARIGVQNLY
jgi:hypothetical protein